MNFKISFPILVINSLIVVGIIVLWSFDLLLVTSDYISFLLFPFIFYFIRFKPIIPFQLTRKQSRLLFIMIVTSQFSELLYFGIPLLGNLSYTEFGFPVIHHISLMMWMLVIFSNKNQKLYLVLHTMYCLLIFNRQYILIGLLAFLFSSKKYLSTQFKITILGLVVLFLSFLGNLRNQQLGVDFTPFDGFISLPLLPYYDFILFFILGPINATLDNVSYTFSEIILSYWNTKPEWALFMEYGVDAGQSFLIFYSILVAIYITIHKLIPSRREVYLPILILYTFLTFFSNVIVSTVFLANFLVLEFILLYCRIDFKVKPN